jgi:hypothetical protein
LTVVVVFQLRFARRACHNAIDAVAIIRLLGFQNEAELFEHDAGEELPDGMCCQPVSFIMTGIVEPWGRRNSSRTWACLDFARALG